MPLAYLSGLGMMGRRHLKGLLAAGFDVVASEPEAASRARAEAEVAGAGVDACRVRFVDAARGRFDVAVFAETAPSRLDNFRRFAEQARASRLLLEKPLATDAAAMAAFETIAAEHGIADRVQVNFVRRAWPHVLRLAQLCAGERRFAVTATGGAVGLGAVGIHLLDTFLLLAGEDVPRVAWCEVSPEAIGSGRGARFRDYGAEFVLRGSRATLFASLEPGSSANVVMVVRGDHFVAQVDFTDMRWRLVSRRRESMLPNYRYGADYDVLEEATSPVPPVDQLTARWATGALEMPSLSQAVRTHRLLFDVLAAGGVPGPYSFT